MQKILQECRELLELLPGGALAKAIEKHPGIGGFAVFQIYAPV